MNPPAPSPSASPLPGASTQRNWLAGGTAVAGASIAASGALAGTVQIDLVNNSYTNGTGGNQLDLDLTGDGVDDLPGLTGEAVPISQSVTNLRYTGNRVRVFSGSVNFGIVQFKAGVFGGVPFKQFLAGRALGGTSFGGPVAKFATVNSGTANQFPALQEYFALIPVTFTDSRINRGAATNGYVETRSYNVSSTEHAVELIRLVFDDASTVLPTGVAKEGTNPAWVDPTPARLARISALNTQIAALERKLKVFKRQRNKAKIAATTRSIRALKAQLAAV
jgi:hypothetical protein